MKPNLLQNVIRFIIRYIWIFCIVLVLLELISTMYSATLLLHQTSATILQAQAGEVSGRVDGILRLLNGLAKDKIIGNTKLPLYDRAIRTISYQNSYELFMIAVLDKDFNMVPANATEPPKNPSSRADRDYLQRMKATETYQITDTIVSRSDGVTRNYTIVVPLFLDGILNGGIYGSIYWDDIETMLERENKGEFFLLGRNQTVMVGGGGTHYDKSLKEVYNGLIIGKAGIDKLQSNQAESKLNGFWIVSPKGLSYLSYCGVDLTEWTLVYEGSLNMVLPAVIPMLIMKVLSYVALCWLIARYGRRYLEHQLSSASHLMDRVTIMQKELFRTEQGDYEELLALTQQGLTDQLTGLSTRVVLIQRFTQLTKDGESNGMLCFLDLDDLKHTNDTFGHDAGDRALLHFAQVLKSYEQKYDGIAARYGGDEFVLALNGFGVAEGEHMADELCRELSTSLIVDTDVQSIAIHGSLGVVFYPLHGRSLEELISKADLALYISKHNSKGRYTIFDAPPL